MGGRVRISSIRRRFLIARQAFRMRHPKKTSVHKMEVPRFPIRFVRTALAKKELGIL